MSGRGPEDGSAVGGMLVGGGGFVGALVGSGALVGGNGLTGSGGTCVLVELIDWAGLPVDDAVGEGVSVRVAVRV